LPEILLEISARTGFADAFTRLTERTARAQDLTTSLCGVLLAEACNTGPEPLIRHDVQALRPRAASLGQSKLPARRHPGRRQCHSGGCAEPRLMCSDTTLTTVRFQPLPEVIAQT